MSGAYERLPEAVSLQDRLAERDAELYRIGRIYEDKGPVGRLVMRMTNIGDKRRELESGRKVYDRHHYREEVVRAYNEEIMASWPKE